MIQNTSYEAFLSSISNGTKMAAKKPANNKLDLSAVLQAIDRRDMDYYSRLTDAEKKAYVPLVLMRYMSSLNDQNNYASYAVIATNDLVNIGFWNLSKHQELQHKLLCLAGIGGKQYRPWISVKKGKNKNKLDSWILSQYPHLNEIEVSLFKSSHTLESWKDLIKSSGVDDAEMKELIETWKKHES